MKKEAIVTGIIGLVIGVVVTGFTAGQAVNTNNTGMMQMMGVDTNKRSTATTTDNDTLSMTEMSSQLKNLSGDEFDKAFLEMMIAHHQGAIDMAALIPARAKHDEVKTLGDAIVAAQTKEIADMRQWQMDWGYMSSGSMPGMNH